MELNTSEFVFKERGQNREYTPSIFDWLGGAMRALQVV